MPPSVLPLNLTISDRLNPSAGQAQKALEFLQNKVHHKIIRSKWKWNISHLLKQKRGFYIEAGAYDGEEWSNSLFMERELEWEGLLIEANPDNVAKLLAKNRKAWIVPAALSISAYPK